MDRNLKSAVAAGFGVLVLACSSQALGDTTVIGGGMAEDCSSSAKMASLSRAPHADAIETCTLALQNEVMSIHDTAATYVNRGVLYLSMANYQAAGRDFDSALTVEPNLAEAFVNRGAALIGQGQDAQGVADIDKGLALNPSEPEKAYFNRALAEERLNDLKAAYLDYQKALELKPGWAMPQTELARFHVVER